MGIGRKIEQNAQLQEFVEKILSYSFDLINYEPFMADEVCEELDITKDEMYWLFEQLGYTKEDSTVWRGKIYVN